MEDLPALEEIADESTDSIEENTGIDWEQDIGNWIGSNISIGITDIDIDQETDFEFAATIDVRDHAAADRFLDTVFDDIEDNNSRTDISRESDYLQFQVWSAEFDQFNLNVALADDIMVIGNDDTFFDVLDRIEQSDLPSLYDDERFMQAKARFADPRFATLYIDYDPAEHELRASQTIGVTGLNDELANDSIRWIAMNAAIHQRAIVTDIVTPRVEFQTAAQTIKLADLASKISDRTAALAAFNVNLDLDYWRQNVLNVTLEEYFGRTYAENLADEANDWIDTPDLTSRSTIGDYLDAAIRRTNELIGINIQTQLLDLLTGTAYFAVENSDWAAVFDSYEQQPVHAIAALEHRSGKANELTQAIYEIEEYAARTLGIDYYQTEVNADQLAIFLKDIPEPYAFGWVISHDHILASTTEQAMLNAVAQLNSNQSSIYQTPQFARISELLPASATSYLFIDLQSIISQIDPEYFNIEYDLYAAIRDILNAAAVSLEENPDHLWTRIAVTLFP